MTIRKLEPWQQRVVEEREQLHDRLVKLDALILTPEFRALPEADRDILMRQQGIMEDYRWILDERIARFAE